MAFTLNPNPHSLNPFQLTGRYAQTNKWEILAGPDDARPTGHQIINDSNLFNAWNDKTIFITGVSSGIGVETVKTLALTGATIYGTARDLNKARAALGDVLVEGGKVHLLFLDQTDLESVRGCVKEFKRLNLDSRLNVLINNAGVMNTPPSKTKDGFETQFGTNHLSHFLLFYLLKGLLLASSTSDFHSRVINVSSSGHRYAPLNFDNLNYEGGYNGWLAYGSSKTANIYMANQIERLYGEKGLHGYSLHPGSFQSPNLQKYSEVEMEGARGNERMKKYFTSLEQACATTVYGAVSAEVEGRGGLYLEGAAVAEFPCPPDGDAIEYGYGSWAFNKEKEEKLWEISKKMVGVE